MLLSNRSGYVYDEETGLYYLQSRYYNPEIGRFISADDPSYLGADGTPLSYNLFAYCANNPANKIDATGKFAISTSIIGLAVAFVKAAIAVVGAQIIVDSLTDSKVKSYTVYTLCDPETDEVVYVGRTSDYKKRMSAHSLNPARNHLQPKILHEGLTYTEARAAEQGYILLYMTLDKKDKAKNQINGVNPLRRDYLGIMGNGFGISEALDSVITNIFLGILE